MRAGRCCSRGSGGGRINVAVAARAQAQAWLYVRKREEKYNQGQEQACCVKWRWLGRVEGPLEGLSAVFTAVGKCYGRVWREALHLKRRGLYTMIGGKCGGLLHIARPLLGKGSGGGVPPLPHPTPLSCMCRSNNLVLFAPRACVGYRLCGIRIAIDDVSIRLRRALVLGEDLSQTRSNGFSAILCF